MTWLQPPRQYEGAPAEHVQGMSLEQLLRRSELSSTIATPGRDAYYKKKDREDMELLRTVCPSDEEESDEDTDEEEEENDNKGKDPDFEEEEDEKPPSLKRAAANGAGPLKRRAANGAGRPRPYRMNDDERAEHEQAKAERKAKKKAAGADELEAAVAALKAHDLYKKKNYQAILAEVENWAADGGTKATAALWIRRLMLEDKCEGTGQLLPSEVRKKYKKTPPDAA